MKNRLIFCLKKWAGGANSEDYFLDVVVEGGVACQELSGHSQILSTHFGQPFGKSVSPEHYQMSWGVWTCRNFSNPPSSYS